MPNEQQTLGERYETSVRIRWSDLDAFGHVNNARALTLLEEARIDWLWVAASEQGVTRLTDGIVVASLNATYLRSIGMGAPVTVSMWVSSLAAATFTVEYEVSAQDRLAIRAATRLAPVDPATFRPRRLDAEERAYLSRFVCG